MAPDRLLELLQCPKCRTVLSSFAHCPGCDTTFPASRGQPVLIDFEDSIFQPSAYLETNAPAPRPQGTKVGRFLSRLTYGGNELAERTVNSLLASLSALSNPRVLIVGGGTIGAGAHALYANPELELIGTDVYASDDTCIVCDGHKLPFRDSSFDAVFIQAVCSLQIL